MTRSRQAFASRALDSRFVALSLTVAGVGFSSGLFFVLYSPFEAGDSYDYAQIASNLLSGNGFAIFPESPTVFRPPGYPLLIAGVYALFGTSPTNVLFVQAGLLAYATWLVFLLGRRLLGETSAALGAALAGSYPHLSFYAGTFLAESLAYFLLALSLLLASLLNQRRAGALTLLTGAVLGALALTVSRFAFLPLGVLVVLAIQRMPLRRLVANALVLMIGYVAFLSPWMVRNAIVFGVPVPFTVGQQPLALWLAAKQVELYDYRFERMVAAEPLIARWWYLYRENPHRERDLFEERWRLDDDFNRDAFARIAADPPGFIAHRAKVVPYLWIQPAIYAGNFRPPFERHNPRLEAMISRRDWLPALTRIAAILVFTFGLFGGAILGFWRLRRAWRETGLLLMPAAYVAVFQTPLWIEHRYSVLSHPFLWLFSAVGWCVVWSSLASRLGARAPRQEAITVRE